MALPFFLFENIYENGIVVASSELATKPVANLLDWRAGTPYRWQAADTTSPVDVEVDLGGGNSAQPEAVAIGGHNLNTADAEVTLEWSDDGAVWTPEGPTVAPTDDLPFSWLVAPVAAHQWWRVLIEKVGGGAFVEAPQIGILTLGRRLDFEHNVEPSLDAYGFEMVNENPRAVSGAFLGVNIRYEVRTFVLSFASVGATRDWHRGVGGRLSFDTDFRSHVRSGAPHWFAWDLTEEPSGLYLTQVDGRVSNPFRDSYKYRTIAIPLLAWRETT